MKRIVFTTVTALCFVMVFQSFERISLGKREGTEPGYTGSPGDSLKNCTACHGGQAIKVQNWITSDIPTEGYVPGKKYKITATNESNGHNRFGFLISPQNAKGDLLGTLSITDSINTKLVGNSKYITYTGVGVNGLNSRTWTFDWTAPTTGVGDVVFYGAFNSNHDGHKGSEITQLSELRVKQSGLAGLHRTDAFDFSIFPNPSTGYLNFSFANEIKNNYLIELIDLNGKKVIEKLVNQEEKTLDVSDVPKGIYFVKMTAKNSTITRKITLY